MKTREEPRESLENRLDELEGLAAEIGRKNQIAKIVAEHWRNESLKDPITRMIAHPCALILAALEGENNPSELGVNPESDTGQQIAQMEPGVRF